MSKDLDSFPGWDTANFADDVFGSLTGNGDEGSSDAGEGAGEGDDNKSKGKNDLSLEEQAKAAQKEQEELEKEAFAEFEIGEEGEDGNPGKDEKPAGNKSTPAKSTPANVTSKATLEFLKEKGLVEFELEEGEELTDEKAEEILEDTWDSSLEAGVEQSIKDLPKEVKDIIKVAVKGGNVMQMLAKMAVQASSGITKDMDMADEANQIKVMKANMREQGQDEEEMDAQIDYLKNSGKLESMSKKAFDKVIAKQESDRQAEVTRAAQSREDAKTRQRTYRKALNEHLGTVDKISGLAISKRDKQELPEFMSEPSVELTNGQVVTPMQAAYLEAIKDKDKSILLATLLKNDFDLSSVEKTAVTKQTRQARKGITNKDNGENGSSHKSAPAKSIADYLAYLD